jgi:hypothetical protein
MGMGGMGGMGMGGMGGMGMGGMGMGGMGGGMGGMGGGFFNVPNNFRPNMLPRGGNGGFFSVADDLNLTPEGEPRQAPAASSAGAPSASAPAAQPKRASQRIRLDSAGAKPADAWEKYFAANRPAAAQVRETVRALWREKKHEEVIALIQAALRHGQVQPGWMYEALSLSLQAAGRPSEDIERAIMSAVDFAQTPLDMMFVALYLEKVGQDQNRPALERRALQVYQQVAQVQPMMPEPYVQGLRVAEKLNDVPGIQWAAAGILSQAWPENQKHVWLKGYRVARATLDRLTSEGRTEEVKAFQQSLDAAVERDCLIVVSWVGDADIDLAVKEPSGSVCSLRNPRTAAGGVMLGDARGQAGKEANASSCEVYACPKGFSGEYQLLVRRVWGQVVGNTVKVDVCKHYLGPKDKQQVLSQSFKLAKDQAAVKFDLADGRRNEPLKEHQIANAAIPHLAARQQILAQQLAGAINPATMMNLANSRTANGGGLGGNGQTPFPMFLGQGAVGYQPVIITLPEGTNLMATGVVSADRRYVRVTCLPLFSGVAEVNVFNTSTGANTQGRGGTGGQGFSGLFGGGGGGGGGGGFF